MALTANSSDGLEPWVGLAGCAAPLLALAGGASLFCAETSAVPSRAPATTNIRVMLFRFTEKPSLMDYCLRDRSGGIGGPVRLGRFGRAGCGVVAFTSPGEIGSAVGVGAAAGAGAAFGRALPTKSGS